MEHKSKVSKHLTKLIIKRILSADYLIEVTRNQSNVAYIDVLVGSAVILKILY